MPAQIFIIKQDNPKRREVWNNAVVAMREWFERGDMQIKLSEIARSLDQNAAMWPALADFADQVPWAVTQQDGTTRQADADDMKDILTAAFETETRMSPGLRGGFVMLGARTSKYGKRKMGDFLTFVRAEGNDRGVVWSEKAKDKFDEFIESRCREPNKRKCHE